jgi:hypothetical protein
MGSHPQLATSRANYFLLVPYCFHSLGCKGFFQFSTLVWDTEGFVLGCLAIRRTAVQRRFRLEAFRSGLSIRRRLILVIQFSTLVNSIFNPRLRYRGLCGQNQRPNLTTNLGPGLEIEKNTLVTFKLGSM